VFILISIGTQSRVQMPKKNHQAELLWLPIALALLRLQADVK